MSDTGAASAGEAPAAITNESIEGGADPNAISGQPGVAGGEGAKAAAREAIRLHKLKIDGQEIEVDEDELKRGYGHQKAANKALQEGLKAKKQAETFVKMMKDKAQLFETLKKLGHDPRVLAEEFLAGQLKREMMDPRDRELEDARARLKHHEDLDKKQKEMAAQQRDAQLKAKYSAEYTEQFVEALKSTGLPPTKDSVGDMAKYIARSAKIGFQMTAAEAAKLVREDIEVRQQKLYGESDAETLARLLGEKGLQKLRAYDAARLKDPNQHLKTPTDQGTVKRRGSQTERMTPQEWRKFNRGY